MKIHDLLTQKEIEAAVFDLDGLIVDTEDVGVTVMTALFQIRYSISLTPEDQHGFYGVPDIVCYERLLRKYALEGIPVELLEVHNTSYNRFIGELQHPLPGTSFVLDVLKEQRIISAICSGSYADQISLILGNLSLRDYFSHITSYEDTVLHKPHPDPYLHACQAIGIPPRKCVAFEDSASGVTSAKTAGLYCVGVMVGNHKTQDLTHADVVVETLEELL